MFQSKITLDGQSSLNSTNAIAKSDLDTYTYLPKAPASPSDGTKFQSLINRLRRIQPYGWSRLIRKIANHSQALKTSRIRLRDGNSLCVDLREKMCFGYFFDGWLPHEHGTELALKAGLGEGAVFVDVGANVGYFTCMGSRLVGETGKVIAVEPMPSALRLLKLNTQNLNNVKNHPVAVGSENGKADFYIRDMGDTSSFEPASNAVKIEVPVRRLDHILENENRVDLVKIDVEGFEFEVLRGMKNIIARHNPTIIFEYLDKHGGRIGETFEEIERFFKEQGYAIAWIKSSPTENGFLTSERTFNAVAMHIESVDRRRDEIRDTTVTVSVADKELKAIAAA